MCGMEPGLQACLQRPLCSLFLPAARHYFWCMESSCFAVVADRHYYSAYSVPSPQLKEKETRKNTLPIAEPSAIHQQK